MLKTKTATVLWACALVLPISLHAQNLLTNGSFELPAIKGGTTSWAMIVLLPGSTNLPGWSIDGPTDLYLVNTGIRNEYGFDGLQATSDGHQYIEFNGKTGGVTLWQAFPTVIGATYEVNFSWSAFWTSPAAEVVAEDGALLYRAGAMPATQPGWESSRFRFTATSPTSKLRFTDTNATVNVDCGIDSVSVEPITPRLSINYSQVRICWEAKTNRHYQLQYRSSSESQWQDTGDPMPGTTNCAFEAITGTQRFFRVVTLP